MHENRSRAGSGLAAAMIAALIIALLLGALLTSGASIHRHSHVSESHLLAMVRARGLLDMVRALDFDVLHAEAGSGELALDLDALLEPGAAARLFFTAGAAALPAYVRKAGAFSERLTWTNISADLARVDVRVTWTEAGKGARVREVRLTVLVDRPEAGYRAPGAGGPA